MRITKELFEKLSKPRQEELKKRLDETKPVVVYLEFFTTYVKWMLFVFGFSLIVLPLWKMAFTLQTFLVISKFFQSAMNIMWLAICLGILIDIAVLLEYAMRKNKIKREYFFMETKVRVK